jgi:hypothetical protein
MASHRAFIRGNIMHALVDDRERIVARSYLHQGPDRYTSLNRWADLDQGLDEARSASASEISALDTDRSCGGVP